MTESDDRGAVLHKHRNRRDFTQIQNSTIRDPNLSLKAGGLLAYLLSLPDGAPCGSREIEEKKPDGRYSVMTAYDELKAAGYVRQTVTRSITGQFETTTHVFEVPPGAETAPGTGKDGPQPSGSKPGAGTATGTGRGNPTRTGRGSRGRETAPSLYERNTQDQRSSSGSSDTPAETSDDREEEDEDFGIWKALADLRRAARRPSDGPLVFPARWYRTTIAGDRAHHADELAAARAAHPTATADELARLLFDGTAPAGPRRRFTCDCGEVVVGLDAYLDHRGDCDIEATA